LWGILLLGFAFFMLGSGLIRNRIMMYNWKRVKAECDSLCQEQRHIDLWRGLPLVCNIE
jgi:hypothetical protein